MNDPISSAKILTALSASRDFMEIMELAHRAGSVLPTASPKVIGEFERALKVAQEQIAEALQLVAPGTKPSAFIFNEQSATLPVAAKH